MLTHGALQEFHVAYIFIKMANSPRPGVFALERSKDYGETWQPWQYFADTRTDCEQFFGEAGYSETITGDDAVICTTDYSKVVPLEGGEVRACVVLALNYIPPVNHQSRDMYSTVSLLSKILDTLISKHRTDIFM